MLHLTINDFQKLIKYLINNETKCHKATNCHILEAGNRECLCFFSLIYYDELITFITNSQYIMKCNHD